MKPTRQSKAKTQLDKANDVLKSLAPNVTAADKKAAQLLARESCTLSRYTINDYLKGEAKDLDIAMDLIRFFEKRIADREKHLAKAAA